MTLLVLYNSGGSAGRLRSKLVKSGRRGLSFSRYQIQPNRVDDPAVLKDEHRYRSLLGSRRFSKTDVSVLQSAHLPYWKPHGLLEPRAEVDKVLLALVRNSPVFD